MEKLLRLLLPFFGFLPHAAHAEAGSSTAAYSELAAAAATSLDIPWWIWAGLGFFLIIGIGLWVAGWGSDPSEETYG